MKDAGHKNRKPATRTGRTDSHAAATPGGDYTSIRVPIPPESAFNKDRPAGCLLQAQLRHFKHAESARLPKQKGDPRRIDEESASGSEVADYIAKVTRLLHPQRRRKPKSASARRATSVPST